MSKDKPVITPARLGIDEPVDNPRNPKLHPAEQLDMLAASVKRFGQPRPILVRADNRMIVAGHGLRSAMRRAGAAEIEVLLWNVDQETADAFMLADNKHGQNGKDDAGRIAELLEGVASDDLASLGFSEAEAKAMLEDGDELVVKEIETGPVEDRFWISVRGPLVDQAEVLKRLRDIAADHPRVDVDLGTVADG